VAGKNEKVKKKKKKSAKAEGSKTFGEEIAKGEGGKGLTSKELDAATKGAMLLPSKGGGSFGFQARKEYEAGGK